MKKEVINDVENREFAADAFTLVNKDLNAKIHDAKFKTKPTTFAKDAFKRFCKNKSSVVGAIIIGTLLLGSLIIPLVSTEDLKSPKIYQNMLQPKLFDAGTGFWDGTKTYKHLVQDRRLVGDKYIMPAGGPDNQNYKESAVVSMKVSELEEVPMTVHSQHAFGGYLICLQDPLPVNTELASKPLYLKNYTPFVLNEADGVKATITFGNQENLVSSNLAQQYRVCLYQNSFGEDVMVAPLTDWAPYQETITVDLSAKLTDLGKTDIQKAKLNVQAMPTVADGKTSTYMSIKSIEFTCNDTTDEEIFDLLKTISFKDRSDEEVVEAHKEGIKLSDANAVAAYEKNKDVCYWQTNSARSCYGAQIRYIDVVYDGYEHVFGNREMTIGGTDLQNYIDKGWCRFRGLTQKLANVSNLNFNIEDYPFEVLDEEHCPILSISSSSYIYSYDQHIWQFETTVCYYKYLGLKSMPRYLVGTDKEGYDLLTRCFKSLRTSLLVAIICVSVCLAIGLVWGAFSGYFGGTVDLVMERITDILNGLPSIILMTLLLILLDRNIFVFALSIIITGWIGTASLTRTQFYRFRDREYVLASRTLGASDTRLIFRHILPNGLGTIITSSVLRVPSFIASEATIAYLGIGLKSTDSFGVVLSQNQRFVETYPHLIVFPTIILALLMICFNLFGNGLRDAVNPTLKGGE